MPKSVLRKDGYMNDCHKKSSQALEKEVERMSKIPFSLKQFKEQDERLNKKVKKIKGSV